MLILELCAESLLNGNLRLGNRQPGDRDGACLRKRDLALTIDRPFEPAGLAASLQGGDRKILEPGAAER